MGLGVICMLIAIVMQNVTLAGGRYGRVLVMALAFTVAADVCFGVVAWKGGVGWRLLAGAMMLPTIYVVADFLRRQPRAF